MPTCPPAEVTLRLKVIELLAKGKLTLTEHVLCFWPVVGAFSVLFHLYLKINFARVWVGVCVHMHLYVCSIL